MTRSRYGPDFRLHGYRAVNDAVEKSFYAHIEADEDSLTALAEHQSADALHSFHVLHDTTATWGIPGEPQIIALHITRDISARSFSFEHTTLPLAAMAQAWLVSRGCPKSAIRLPPDLGTVPADETTSALQDRLVGDGDRFALLYSYTDDAADHPRVTVLLRSLAEKDPHPFRVLVEQADLKTFTHTLREGGFPTYEAALTWLDDPDQPLRPIPPATRRPGMPAPAPPAMRAAPRRIR
ncbi:hypothetical protein [Streptomyces sp. NPDC048340]|uniref:hypothetical protein n=1 Tax=Streptomyces sp. NPDC048340 TaxID=3365537 RepID=UPI003713AFEA